jgi:hypothetical protein
MNVRQAGAAHAAGPPMLDFHLPAGHPQQHTARGDATRGEPFTQVGPLQQGLQPFRPVDSRNVRSWSSSADVSVPGRFGGGPAGYSAHDVVAAQSGRSPYHQSPSSVIRRVTSKPGTGPVGGTDSAMSAAIRLISPVASTTVVSCSMHR